MKTTNHVYYCGKIVCAMLSLTIVAAPGDLDITFNGTGIVLTSIGRMDYINDVTVQADGDIVVAGVVTTNAAIILAAARYTTAGVLDATFNGTGIHSTLIGTMSQGTSVAMQADDKIVVGGLAYTSQTLFALVRYNINGTLDATFNGTGIVTTAIGSGAQANSIAIQGDGSIIAAGSSVNGGPEFTLARYDSTGALDPAFGTGGIVLTQIGLQSSIHDIALQADGKIVAVGYTFDGAMIGFALARYNTDGTLDGTFGTSGFVATMVGSEAIANSVAIQTDGSIVVAGYTIEAGVRKFVVARYTSAGVLDATFNGTGITITQIQHEAEARGVGIQTDDLIVAAGYSVGDVPIQFALARYTTAGVLDATYGVGGIVVTTMNGNLSEANANNLVLQTDDKAVAAGFSDLDFALARYLAT